MKRWVDLLRSSISTQNQRNWQKISETLPDGLPLPLNGKNTAKRDEKVLSPVMNDHEWS